MVGFDGLTIGKYMVPRLTSVGIAWYRVALAALEALIESMEDGELARAGKPRVERFAPELVYGESVAARTGAGSSSNVA